LALVLAMPVSAQTPPPAPQPQTQPPAPRDQTRAAQQMRSPVEGDLVSVDAKAKTITIQPATGAEQVIAYSDTTEISGAQKDAAGLATMKNAQVTVHFTEDAQTKAKTATRIIVQAKK
jgi:predicted carbohydrate-binding protein with CBM5 and CBM33 domain